MTSITRKINFLNATKIPLDMPSTQILCKGSFKCRNWLDGIPSVGGLPGWNREGKILVWVDNGNSWTRPRSGEMLDHSGISND